MQRFRNFVLLLAVFTVTWRIQLVAAFIGPPIKPTGPTTVRTTVTTTPPEKFYLGTEKMNWYGANVYCQRNSWKLLVLKSAEIQKEFEDFINQKNLQNFNYWTAGNQLVDMKTWHWDLGGPVFNYTHWANGQPNNYKGSQHCLQLFADSLQWDDCNCEIHLNFACLKY